LLNTAVDDTYRVQILTLGGNIYRFSGAGGIYIRGAPEPQNMDHVLDVQQLNAKCPYNAYENTSRLGSKNVRIAQIIQTWSYGQEFVPF